MVSKAWWYLFFHKESRTWSFKGTNSRIKIWSRDCLSKVKVNSSYLPQFFILFNSSFSPNSARLIYNKKISWLWQLCESWLVAFSVGSLGKHPSGPTLKCRLRLVLHSLDGLTYSQDFIPCVCVYVPILKCLSPACNSLLELLTRLLPAISTGMPH